MTIFKALPVALILAACAATPAQENTNRRDYGNCFTVTVSDPMVNGIGAYFGCGSGLKLFAVGQAIDSQGKEKEIRIQTRFTRRLSAGVTYHQLLRYPPLEVRLRVDTGEILVGVGRIALGGVLYITDDALAREMIRLVVNGRKLHFSIDGGGSTSIDLDGAESAAVDMIQRLVSASR